MLMVVVFSTLFHLDTTHEHTYTRKCPHKQTHTHKVTRNTVVVVDVVSWGREKKPVTEIDGVVFESIFDFTHWKQTKNTAKMSQLFFGWCEYFSDPGWRFFVHFFYTILTRKSSNRGRASLARPFCVSARDTNRLQISPVILTKRRTGRKHKNQKKRRERTLLTLSSLAVRPFERGVRKRTRKYTTQTPHLTYFDVKWRKRQNAKSHTVGVYATWHCYDTRQTEQNPKTHTHTHKQTHATQV